MNIPEMEKRLEALEEWRKSLEPQIHKPIRVYHHSKASEKQASPGFQNLHIWMVLGLAVVDGCGNRRDFILHLQPTLAKLTQQTKPPPVVWTPMTVHHR